MFSKTTQIDLSAQARQEQRWAEVDDMFRTMGPAKAGEFHDQVRKLVGSLSDPSFIKMVAQLAAVATGDSMCRIVAREEAEQEAGKP